MPAGRAGRSTALPSSFATTKSTPRIAPIARPGGMLDQIERDIRFSGSLSAEQRAKLMEIADKCPVHRTLTSEIKIRTREIAE